MSQREITLIRRTTLDDYDRDRTRWHQPGKTVERTAAVLGVTGAQIDHDGPRIDVRATQVGYRRIVVIVTAAGDACPAPSSSGHPTIAGALA